MTILQIKHMAALPLTASFFFPRHFLQTVLEICYLLPKTNIGTLVVSIVTIVCLIIAKEINAYLSKKIPVPIPVELLAVSTTHTHKGMIRPAPVAAVLIALSADCYCHNHFVAG